MAKNKDKDWSQDRQGAVQFVFHTHFWGDRNNAGVNYKRKAKERLDPAAAKAAKKAKQEEAKPVAKKKKK